MVVGLRPDLFVLGLWAMGEEANSCIMLFKSMNGHCIKIAGVKLYLCWFLSQPEESSCLSGRTVATEVLEQSSFM